jgi:hypothetical protein
MRRSQVGLAVVVVGALVLAYGVLSLNWFVSPTYQGAKIRIGLRAIELCVLGTCQSVGLGQVMGEHGMSFRLCAGLTLAASLLAAAAAIGGVFLHTQREDERVLRWSMRAAGFAGGGVVLSYFTFPGGGVEVGSSFWLALVGALAIVGGALATLMTEEWSRTAIPVAASAGPAAQRYQPRPAPAPRAAPREPEPRVPPADPREREAELAAGTLRHVVRGLEIDSFGLRATGDGDQVRELAWLDLATVRVGLLPAGTPLGRLVFVDLVPYGAPPFRVTPSTRANYDGLPGGASTSIENLRRLAAYATAKNPGATVDAESEAFVGGGPPAAFASLTSFASYDLTLG